MFVKIGHVMPKPQPSKDNDDYEDYQHCDMARRSHLWASADLTPKCLDIPYTLREVSRCAMAPEREPGPSFEAPAPSAAPQAPIITRQLAPR
jgi:hypothetical protein